MFILHQSIQISGPVRDLRCHVSLVAEFYASELTNQEKAMLKRECEHAMIRIMEQMEKMRHGS